MPLGATYFNEFAAERLVIEQAVLQAPPAPYSGRSARSLEGIAVCWDRCLPAGDSVMPLGTSAVYNRSGEDSATTITNDVTVNAKSSDPKGIASEVRAVLSRMNDAAGFNSAAE